MTLSPRIPLDDPGLSGVSVVFRLRDINAPGSPCALVGSGVQRPDKGGGMARSRTWALVTNGVHARILRGLETGDPEDPIEIVSKAESTHLGELRSDRAGRSLASDHSGRRSGMEPGSDPVLRGMQDFGKEVLGLLESHFREGHFDRLAVFAAPKMLGVLRNEMSPSLRAVVVTERDANLAGLPMDELWRTVRKGAGIGPKD